MQITAEIFLEVSKRRKRPYYYNVSSDAVPDDAKLVGVRLLDGPLDWKIIEITFESEELGDANKQLIPVFERIEMPDGSAT